ncbi:hypothetical protein BOTBODRAFT_144128 [Botryobasidium botryosum FD-172 SS1]|uniref:MYND-type domain-containing protein n=1 Tax=Botryobasidium botryosum (strain FD-172 SS1) TaxID=930990 RepID=A0A067MZ78_BOTB1|nr:hypothetical protein BOTBODRAFT_144128 [Botryobasidium botryosum FD-172 SS1]
MHEVILPLQKIDKCAVCASKKTLRLCSACAERIYCSPECQTKDWKSHKANCKNTSRIDLGLVYPFFAICADGNHLRPEVPIHPALQHQVTNSPVPDAHPMRLPDGSSAKIVKLGKPISPGNDSEWWPTAPTPMIRGKLCRRILREGYNLQIHFALALALVSELYTTPNDTATKRLRLRYRSSPIADFGMAWGSARVTTQDTFAYVLPDGTIRRGQDPNDHYWPYFTTAGGEDIAVDFGMFTFNMCMCVQSAPYVPAPERPNLACPVFFRDRQVQMETPGMYKERKRWSILRNETVHKALCENDTGDLSKPLWDVMDTISSTPCGKVERDLLMMWFLDDKELLSHNMLKSEAWTMWPESPPLAIETHPGETNYSAEEEERLEKSIEECRKAYYRNKRKAKKVGK